jgi:hypothetical protein
VNRLSHPVLDYLLLQLQVRHRRARAEGAELGASAVEWIVISAIVVAIVTFVGVIIRGALEQKAGDVQRCIQGANGTAGCQ